MPIKRSRAAVLVLSLIGISACQTRFLAPEPAPTITATPAVATGPAFVDDIRLELAGELLVPIEAIQTRVVQPVDWPDACLGTRKSSEMCLQVITPGYRLIFSTPMGDVEVHTDKTGETFRRVDEAQTPIPASSSIVIAWERSGGIAGICEVLTIDVDSSYHLQMGCTEMVQSSGVIPASAMQELMRWREEYASFTWKSTPPPNSADMFTANLVFNGTGTRVASETEQSEIVALVESLLAGLLPDVQSTPSLGGSGIEGTVVIGPTCPVMLAENPCEDRPYQATVSVFSSKGNAVTSFVSQADGTFRLSLPAGKYILQGESDGAYPGAPRLEVTVENGRYTSIVLMYDTGIR